VKPWIEAEEIGYHGYYWVLLKDGKMEPAFFLPGGRLNGTYPPQKALVWGPIDPPKLQPRSKASSVPMIDGWYWIIYDGGNVTMRWVKAGWRFPEGIFTVGPIDPPAGPEDDVLNLSHLAATCFHEGEAKGWSNPDHHIRERKR
jgi:hypothetical protein